MSKVVFILYFCSFAAFPATISNASVEEESQQVFVKGLQSPDWKTRYETMERLKSVEPTKIGPELRDALIRLLKTEAARRQNLIEGKITFDEYRPPGAEARAFADYYQALIDKVSALHDERALPILVNYVSQSGAEGNRQLASYGPRVLNQVLDRLENSRDDMVRGAMADILSHMLIQNRKHEIKPGLSEEDLKRISESLRPVLSTPNAWTQLDVAFALALAEDRSEAERIRDVFVSFLDGKVPVQRLAALKKMRGIEDPRFVPLSKVRELAQNDDFHVDLTENPALRATFGSEYPVRQLAREVVEKFSKKQ
jgi:hypothetical protein